MNQPNARVNKPYATLTLASALHEMFGVQLYKNNARTLLSSILSILNLDWLQHARSVRGVYECSLFNIVSCEDIFMLIFIFKSYIPSKGVWIYLSICFVDVLTTTFKM